MDEAESLLSDTTLSPADKSKKLMTLKKDQLKQCVLKRNLSASGNKPDLVKRLVGGGGGGGDTAAAAMEANGGGGRQTRSSSKRQRTLSENRRRELKEERQGIVLWKRPLTTLYYGSAELLLNLADWCSQMLQRRLTLLLLAVVTGAVVVGRRMDGPHQALLEEWEAYLMWCAWWVGLGVLSSVGLGTGLHTFLLYLGPHIASVTLAAYECGSTDFPSPPYPDSIVCPELPEGSASPAPMTVWQIVSKVRVEAFCWGFGTALGELPPYFMARAHRLSGHDPEDNDSDDEEKEFLELQKKRPDELSTLDRAKLKVEQIVEKLGFFGILACASIPNPLFDLAGITCGHFLVPFWTFFGATVIGKAVIKMNIQKMFIILAFNEKLIAYAVGQLHTIPVVGPKLEGPFKQALALQKEKLHRKSGGGGSAGDSTPLLGQIFEKLVLAMVAYFVVSILNSLAQSYHKRIHKEASAANGRAKKADKTM